MFNSKKIFLTICLILLALPFYPAKAAEIPPKESFIIKSRDLIQTESDLKSLDISDYKRVDELGAYEAETTQKNIDAMARKESVIYAEKNRKIRLSQVPNDPGFTLQKYLPASNIVNAWDISRGSPSVIVAVVDTGVDYLHEDLRNQMWTSAYGSFGYDFVNGDTDPMDDNGHGTEVSGIIAAQSGNGIGIAGAANIKIMAVKAVPASGEGDVLDLARGIIYAADNGARVVNVSLGLAEDSQTLSDAIDHARQKNSLVVAATGNLYRSFIDNPARDPNVVGVGAIDDNGIRAAYSNYGDGISLVAPGNGIYSSTWNTSNSINGYQAGNGTSFATPQVTGTAALLISKDPSLTSDQVKKRFISSARKLSAMNGAGYSIEYGYGKLDAYAALTYDKIPPTITVSIYNGNSANYTIKGTIADDINSSVSYPSTPDSNIGLIRYQVDGNGNWVTLNSSPTQLANLNVALPNLGPGDHNILLEANDTSGNKTNVNLNTRDALTTPASNNISDYKYSFVSQSSYINTAPGQVTNVTLALQNAGSSAWNKSMVRLATSRPLDRASVFADSSWASSNRIAMQEDVVPIGGVAHFGFSVTAPGGLLGNFNEYFNLVADGVGWLSDMGIFWRISIGAPSYHAQFTDQSPYITMNRGTSAIFWVEYKNTGSTTWDTDVVKLGTSNPLDRSSPFYNATSGSGWLGPNRISMSTNNIAPGQNVRFNFTALAPSVAGTYREAFRPVADGISWLEDAGLFWNVIVQ